MKLMFLVISIAFVSRIYAQECCPDANHEQSFSSTSAQKAYQLLLTYDWNESLRRSSIASFFKKYNIRYRKYEMMTGRRNNLLGISFDLGKDLELSFSINKFRYVKSARPKGGWLLSQVMKEQFFQARILNDGQCLKCYQ